MADPNFVMIDLAFESLDEAEAFLLKLREVWEGPGKAAMQNPQAWIVETMETAVLGLRRATQLPVRMVALPRSPRAPRGALLAACAAS